MMDQANAFTCVYFDILSKKYKSLLKGASFIGNDKREFIGLTKFMFLFGRWAFLDRFTNSKIKLNNF